MKLLMNMGGGGGGLRPCPSYLHTRNIHHNSKSSGMITITGNIFLIRFSFIQCTSFTAPHAVVYLRFNERTRTSWAYITSLRKIHQYEAHSKSDTETTLVMVNYILTGHPIQLVAGIHWGPSCKNNITN
jgi:hypothetical protein